MYVIVGSITSAIRLSKLIEKYSGLPTSVVHTPSALNKGGCSYSVKTEAGDTKMIFQLAKEAGVTIKGIYGEKIESGGRVFYDLS